MKKVILAVGMILCSAVQSGVEVQQQPKVQIDLNVQVKLIDDCPELQMIYTNAGREDVYIDPEEPLFMIVGPNGEKIQFIGPLIDSPPLTIEGYVKLVSGENYKISYGLIKNYSIRDRGEYIVEVGNGYLDPIALRRYDYKQVRVRFHYDGKCDPQ